MHHAKTKKKYSIWAINNNKEKFNIYTYIFKLKNGLVPALILKFKYNYCTKVK